MADPDEGRGVLGTMVGAGSGSDSDSFRAPVAGVITAGGVGCKVEGVVGNVPESLVTIRDP